MAITESATQSEPIDAVRPIKVICIGAGMSGIICGVRFPQRIENLDLTIYEKNDDVGGVWYENRYPGVTCDVPSHAFQFTFASNTNWSSFFAPGQEISKYFRTVAEKYDVLKYVRFKHEFKKAVWLEDLHKWEVTILRMEDNTEFKDYADVLVKATGNLNKWKWPDIEGLHDFKGPVMHSANYDTSFDPTEKRVSVIGSGSSAVQIVPAMLPQVKYMDHYVRGRAWISPAAFVAADPRKANSDVHNFEHPAEERKSWSEHPETYLRYRHQIEDVVNRAQLVHWRGSAMNKSFSKETEESMIRRLSPKPAVWEALRPDYPPLCRRVAPGPRYLECLVDDSLNFIPKGIKKVTENGIIDADGVFRETDAIVCATGFDTSLNKHESPIYGQGGISIDDVWQPDPIAYMSILPAKMPNLSLFVGPNGGSGAGSTIQMSECVAEYVIKCIQKLQRENLKTIVAKQSAVDAFRKQAGRYFTKTTFTYTCNNWAKRHPDGRIIGFWPGSAIHLRKALEHPRWEDFEYESMDEDSLAWMGDGLVLAQLSVDSTTGYLDLVDVPDSEIYKGVAIEGARVANILAEERVVCSGKIAI
uniref:FAD/NAD(P)-binding domain-containing protein n=1 Tax=Bionectria ochroleuca TaxID=29856 RepID=A0A8H7KFR0_BIOOC